MAHSLVMAALPLKIDTFKASAEYTPRRLCFSSSMPVSTLTGVQEAAEVGKSLAEQARSCSAFVWTRVLAWLSREARRILDARGLNDVKISLRRPR